MYLLVTGFYAFLSHLDYLYAAVAAYLCGCFNGALFTSRLFFHDDVRTHGSGNAGLTNFYRTYGARYALLVIACDMLKAVAAVSLAAWLGARFDPRMLPDLPLTAAEQAEVRARLYPLLTEQARRYTLGESTSVPVELASAVTAMGIPTVGISSWEYLNQEAHNPLHAHLKDVCRVSIDNRAPYGDACLQPEGLEMKAIPASTVLSVYAINSLFA